MGRGPGGPRFETHEAEIFAQTISDLRFFPGGVGSPLGRRPTGRRPGQRINGLLGVAGSPAGPVSISIVRPATGSRLRKDPSPAPHAAPNMKVITSAAAFETLGPDFSLSTRIGLCGDRLVVIGGDPLLGYWDKDPGSGGFRLPEIIPDVVFRLRGMGIETISDIVLDTSIFDGQRVLPTWPKISSGRNMPARSGASTSTAIASNLRRQPRRQSGAPD